MWAKDKDKTTDCNIGHILFYSCHFAYILYTGNGWCNNVIVFQQNAFLYLFWQKEYVISFLNNFKGKDVAAT